MNEEFKMSNGQIVRFTSYLNHDGISIYLDTKLNQQDKKQFSKEIREARDVVVIRNKMGI